MNLKCIGIDIGHNLRCDVGAVGIRREDELNLLVGKSLIKKFRAKEIKVVECLPSSASNHRDSLSKRCRAANYGKVDVFLSIHHNACPGGYGSECLCIKGGQRNALSERLSKVILEEVCKLGLRNRGVKDRRDLYVINIASAIFSVSYPFISLAESTKAHSTIIAGIVVLFIT